MNELTNFVLEPFVAIGQIMQRYDTLVMGGGGVKSIAYLGAMEEMHRMGFAWPRFCSQLRVVAGSSAGSFSAACVALGLPLDHLDLMMRSLDSSQLVAPSVLDAVIRGLDTVFSFPNFGLIPFERLVKLYEGLVEQMGLQKDCTLESFDALTGKRLDVYVTNLSDKRLECWNSLN